jgi:predicted ferric reductase
VPLALVALFSWATIFLVILARAHGWELSPLTWYLARASGITLYLLLWGSTVLGLGMTTRCFGRTLSKGVIFSLHAYLTALSFAFLALHMLTLGADHYTAFTAADLLVPFHAGVREPWTGLGIIAGYLLVGIAASFGLRRLTGYAIWRKAHWLTLPLMAIGFLHGVGAGTDSATRPMTVVYGMTGTIVLVLVLYRALLGRRVTPVVEDAPPLLDRMTERSPRRREVGHMERRGSETRTVVP